MLQGRLVLCTVLIIFGSLPAVPGDGPVRFVEPTSGSVLIGPTDFRFAITEVSPAVDRIDVYVDGVLIGSALPPGWNLSWDAPPDVSGAAVVAVAMADGVAIGTTRLQTSELGFGSEITVNVVQLYPVVVDRRGRFVRNLDRGDFRVLDDGGPVEIDAFATEATSLSIAVVLDVSASMVDRLGLVQDASCGFVDQLRDGDEVSVYAFNQSLRTVVPPTMDREAAKKGIRSMVSGGGTAMFDSMIRVLENMRRIPGRRAVFLFSDGMDGRSVASLQSVVDAARGAEAIIYAVGAGDDAQALEAREDLRVLADETGGEAHFILKLKELPAVFDSVLEHLRSQYVLSYQPPEGPPGRRSIEVTLPSREHRRYSVHCRSSYDYHGRSE